MSNRHTSSYSTIFKSTSQVGSGEFVKVLIGLVQTKVAAVFLGPEGIGLIGLFSSSMNMLGVLSGLGIRSSAIRDLSQAHGEKDDERLSRTVHVLRRVCWLTGLVGWLLTILLSRQLSLLMFGTANYATAIGILGVTILLGQLTAGQEVLLRGTRRITVLTIQSILGVLVSAIMSIFLYVKWGRDGIVPAIIVSAFISLLLSWLFARRVPIHPVAVNLRQAAEIGLSLTKLGVAFMLPTLLGAFVAWATHAYLASNVGLSASGIYRSAWSLSGQFATFILGAMAIDYYPRLSGASSDHREMATLVNEQMEIGILLALPGLIATIVFAPLLVPLFFSEEFAMAANLVPWFVIGIFIRVFLWPMATVQMAMGLGRSFAITQTLGHIIHLALIFVLTDTMGVIGCAIAFALMNGVMIIIVKRTVSQLIPFQWSSSVRGLLTAGSATIILAFTIVELASLRLAISLGSLLVAICSFLCLSRVLSLLGPEHKLSRLLRRIPFFTQTL